MAYRFQSDETVEDGVRRIFREQIDGAVAALEENADDPETAVHEARKHCKRIRALMRLVRPGIEEIHQRENAWFRDAASSLSDVRDADVMIETADLIIATAGKKIPEDHASAVRAELTRRRNAIVEARVDDESRIEQFKALISDARRRADDWPQTFGGIETAMAGLKKTYKRGRSAMKDAFAEGESEAYHEWRKRVKYHRHHIALLQDMRPKKLPKRWQASKGLSDILGEDHDLCVLRDALRADAAAFGDEAVSSFSKAIEKRVKKLRKKAGPVGADLFDAKPGDLADWIGSRWTTWMTADSCATGQNTEESVESGVSSPG